MFYLIQHHSLYCFLQALLHSVPFGKMIVLDLFAEVKPIWNTSAQFYGTPYIWYIIVSVSFLWLCQSCILRVLKFQVHASQFWRQHWNVWCSWFYFFRTGWCSCQQKFNDGIFKTKFIICFKNLILCILFGDAIIFPSETESAYLCVHIGRCRNVHGRNRAQPGGLWADFWNGISRWESWCTGNAYIVNTLKCNTWKCLHILFLTFFNILFYRHGWRAMHAEDTWKKIIKSRPLGRLSITLSTIALMELQYVLFRLLSHHPSLDMI